MDTKPRLFGGLARRSLLEALSVIDESSRRAQPNGGFLRRIKTTPAPASMIVSTVTKGPHASTLRICPR